MNATLVVIFFADFSSKLQIQGQLMAIVLFAEFNARGRYCPWEFMDLWEICHQIIYNNDTISS